MLLQDGEFQREIRPTHANFLDPVQQKFNQEFSTSDYTSNSLLNLDNSTFVLKGKDAKNVEKSSSSPSDPSCKMSQTNFTLLAFPSERYFGGSIEPNYSTREDVCDENIQENSCSQLLHKNFPTTTVPNSVASFSSSSVMSALQDTIFYPSRGRLKGSIPKRRASDCRILQRQRSLLSSCSRRLFVCRRNCRSLFGDAVLTFMLFLAMLHLSW